MECGLEPANLFQCQYAEYTRLSKKTFWGFTIQGHDHIDNISPNQTSMDLHPCVDVVDELRGKLEVGQCFLPKAAAGPYWVYTYDEKQGYAAVGGGPPKESFQGGCRTGTGHVNAGLWIFTRSLQRNDTCETLGLYPKHRIDSRVSTHPSQSHVGSGAIRAGHARRDGFRPRRTQRCAADWVPSLILSASNSDIWTRIWGVIVAVGSAYIFRAIHVKSRVGYPVGIHLVCVGSAQIPGWCQHSARCLFQCHMDSHCRAL